MEPLSAVISLLRPSVVRPKLIAGAGRWGVRYPAVAVAGYGLVITGRCLLAVAGRSPIGVAAGDFVLMPPSLGFVMASDLDVEPVAAGMDDGTGIVDVRHGDPQGDADFRMLGGSFRFDPANLAVLADLLPGPVHVSGSEIKADRLSATIRLATDEAIADRPGRDLILERLVEIMLVEALRHGADDGRTDGTPGLLRGLKDPLLARALRSIHADLKRRWTVADLARTAGLSRSAFAERFAAAVGLPPMEYLIQWRMAVARDRLRRSDIALEDLACSIGYQSASAFSTAFRKAVGLSPSHFARETRSADPGAPPAQNRRAA